MKKYSITLPIAFACLMALSACSQDHSMAYKLSIQNQEKKDELIAASVRMVERRIEALQNAIESQEETADVTVNTKGEEPEIMVKMNDENVLDTLTERVIQPTTIQYMKQVPVEEAAIVVAETEGFAPVELDGTHIAWLEATTGTDGKGIVTVQFTSEGVDKKKEIFSELKGQNIGIFVRGVPAYKFLVEEEDIQSDTLQIKIPDPEMARIFADDVNVGLHVLFLPIIYTATS